MIIKLSTGEKIYVGINYLFIIFLCATTIYPFIYVFSASISNAEAILTNRVVLFPVGINWNSYINVINYPYMWRSYGNTLYVTLVGTALNLLLTIFAAYPLSKKRFAGRNFFMFIITFTMWFSGGIIPLFMVFYKLNLTNKLSSLIIGFAITSFYVIMLRTFFQNIPDSMEESAKIDGANDMVILFRIILPLTIPALATIGLYYAVNRWNGFFWAMVLIQEKTKRPLQVLLREMIIQAKFDSEMEELLQDPKSKLVPENIKYAAIMVGTVPILCAYPFIQKYFVKGVMIGSIKG